MRRLSKWFCRNKTRTRRQRMFGSGFLKILVVCFLLLCLSFELSNHNRQRAALMPMMVGMMVRMVAMMSSTEAHKFPAD
jgi:glycerol uptake facilitator-like aquaporin